jgi:hypothetical protein
VSEISRSQPTPDLRRRTASLPKDSVKPRPQRDGSILGATSEKISPQSRETLPSLSFDKWPRKILQPPVATEENPFSRERQHWTSNSYSGGPGVLGCRRQSSGGIALGGSQLGKTGQRINSFVPRNGMRDGWQGSTCEDLMKQGENFMPNEADFALNGAARVL